MKQINVPTKVLLTLDACLRFVIVCSRAAIYSSIH